MKTIYLVRHSKAVQRQTKLPDFERKLIKSGEKNSLNMAKKLKKEGIAPDLLMSSTASRALETAHLFAKGLDYPLEKIMVKDTLYNEISSEALLYIIRQVDDKFASLMMFGHNPAFTELAAYLIRDFEEDIPKSGVVGINFNVKEWKNVVKERGKLVLYDYPKRIAKTYLKLESELGTAIADNIQDLLASVNDKAAGKERKTVQKASARIAAAFMKTMKASQSKAEKKALADKANLPKEPRRPSPKTQAAAKPNGSSLSKRPARPRAVKPAPKTAATSTTTAITPLSAATKATKSPRARISRNAPKTN